MSEPTAVYHFYDADDDLVYVGITSNVERRWREHRGWPWMDQVVRREFVVVDSRTAALQAERNTVIKVLRESMTPMPETEAETRRRHAVAFAIRVGWSKYQIAEELHIKPDDVRAIVGAEAAANIGAGDVLTLELRESQDAVLTIEAIRRRRQDAVMAAIEAGWTKYKIATLLDIKGPTVDSIIKAAEKEPAA